MNFILTTLLYRLKTELTPKIFPCQLLYQKLFRQLIKNSSFHFVAETIFKIILYVMGILGGFDTTSSKSTSEVIREASDTLNEEEESNDSQISFNSNHLHPPKIVNDYSMTGAPHRLLRTGTISYLASDHRISSRNCDDRYFKAHRYPPLVPLV